MINGKTIDELIKEANKALAEIGDEKMSQEEMAEEDAEAGYFEDD